MTVKQRVAALALVAFGASGVATSTPAMPDDPVARLGMAPSFTEEFGGSAVSGRKWTTGAATDTVDQRSLFNNAEREIYLDPAYLGLGVQPLSVGKGLLTITARPLSPAERSVVAAAVRALPPDKANGPLKDLAYSSGSINTRGRFAQTYGYFEIRARFPEGRGLWPAFWMLPADGSWPPEIDVVEVLGHEPNRIYETVHSTAMGQQHVEYRTQPTADGFHRYGALWTPTIIDFYVDGARVGTAKTPPDMHKPMYLVVNLAVGGNWPGNPDANTKFPAHLDVDYVRAWKFRKTPAS